ncbi:hypothetical protein [uncultured Treponema sp.]|uniref:hypothetical protein n=1 Tax=uncultured Treponema sp. TaxID=162155 RepID=UPI0025F78CD0|nr:hypothetical protein [uncultured Treponema sp.]
MNTREMPKTISLNGVALSLLTQFPVNDHFQIGIYQGTLSQFDMLVRYKQLINGEWTRARTPKHIHWAVDILIKQHENPEATNRFLDFLLHYWNSVTPLLSENERSELLEANKLLDEVNNKAVLYQDLAGYGEYSIKFLILLAKLLMIQEKTNYHEAYMFKNLLEQLKAHKDLYKIISTATHR